MVLTYGKWQSYCDVLPPTKRILPGRPKKKRRLESWELRKDDTQVRQGGTRKRCAICKQLGHKQNNCPQAPPLQQQPNPTPSATQQGGTQQLKLRLLNPTKGKQCNPLNLSQHNQLKHNKWLNHRLLEVRLFYHQNHNRELKHLFKVNQLRFLHAMSVTHQQGPHSEKKYHIGGVQFRSNEFNV